MPSLSPQRIYLACPYSDPDAQVREYRNTKANRAAAWLMLLGHLPYSPLSHTQSWSKHAELPYDFGFWSAHCLAFVDWCEALVVLSLKGWNKSRGVAAEIDHARAQGKPVVLLCDWMMDGVKVRPLHNCASARIAGGRIEIVTAEEPR